MIWADHYLKKEDYPNYLKYLEMAADNGNPKAIFDLATALALQQRGAQNNPEKYNASMLTKLLDKLEKLAVNDPQVKIAN